MPIDVGSPYDPPNSPEWVRPQGGPWKWIALAAVVAAIAAVTAVLIFWSGSVDDGADARAAYRTQLDAALAPVIAANREVSSALGRLNVEPSLTARRSVSRAQTAVATARGAVNALAVPVGSEGLATQARQTLSRESTFFGVVRTALTDPSGPSVAQVQTQAGTLRDALDVIAPPGADWGQSVSGVDNVPAWARRNIASERRAARRTGEREQATSPSVASGAPSAPAPASGTDCGGGLRAGPNTTCSFAENVREAYFEAPGVSPTVEVYSPVTGQTYTMSCAPAGSGTSCSGGNDASVSF